MLVRENDGSTAGFNGKPRDQDAGETSLPGTFEDCLPVGIELSQVQMAVGVGQQHGFPGGEDRVSPFMPLGEMALNLQLFQTSNLQSILEDRLHQFLVGGLTVDAHDGFRAGKSDQHPTAIFEFELESIHCHQFGHF
jgi:hypothetical protein